MTRLLPAFSVTVASAVALALAAAAQCNGPWTELCDVHVCGTRSSHEPGTGSDISSHGRCVALVNFDSLDPVDDNGVGAASWDVHVRAG